MHKAIIVEDELHSRDFLKNIISEFCPQLNVVAVAASVDEGVAAIRTRQPELVFLDVEMQTGTGFDLLRQFPDPQFNVIFTTAYDHYAMKAIKFSAVDYLLKPIEIEELQVAVNKWIAGKTTTDNRRSVEVLLQNLQSLQHNRQSIGLSTSEGLEFVPLTEITHIESSGPYSHFFIKGKQKIIVSRHLKEFELLLAEHGFFRAHNSHIVNLKEVRKYLKSDGGVIVMNDNTLIPVSPKKKDEFLLRVQQQRLV